MSKILVSYFSASGVTRNVAEKVANALGGDLFEIVPTEKYTNEDLDWTNKESRSSVEMRENIKPKITKNVENLNDYDTICLGFPIWWYKEPTIIDEFLDQNDMSSKKIYVFVTSGSSSIDSTYKSLKTNYPNLNFVSGKRFTGNELQEEIKAWVL